MTAHELIGLHDELEQMLQLRRPAQFIRELRTRTKGVRILVQDGQHLGAGRLSTRFLYCDPSGGEASLIVISEVDGTGKLRYSLECVERS